MKEPVYIWEKPGFKKDPFRVPDDYFVSLSDRIMDSVNVSGETTVTTQIRLLKPWMLWVSGIAALLVFGFIGFRLLYVGPSVESKVQASIEVMVDFYGGELGEVDIVAFANDHKIELGNSNPADMDHLIQAEPDLAEEYILESLGIK